MLVWVEGFHDRFEVLLQDITRGMKKEIITEEHLILIKDIEKRETTDFLLSIGTLREARQKFEYVLLEFAEDRYRNLELMDGIT